MRITAFSASIPSPGRSPCPGKRSSPAGDLLPRRSGRRQLLELAARQIQRQEQAGTARYRPDWRRQLRRRFNPQNYYLTEEGLAFFYPMYAIAPAVEGLPTFLLPYGESLPSPRRDEGA